MATKFLGFCICRKQTYFGIFNRGYIAHITFVRAYSNTPLSLDNAFGLITAAHLLTQQTRQNNNERYNAKLRLMRLLYERQWERMRIVELLRVIDWFLELPKGLRQKLKTEIYRMEEQQKMTYVTSFERDAKEEGIVIGKELGVVEGIEIGRVEVARKLMANGFSAEQAASIADVSVALLQSS